MKSIFIYILLLATVIPAARSQNIFSGGNSDGFSANSMGFDIYGGGISNGFATDSILGTPINLPITLVDFTAAALGSQVRLSWQTTSEINNDHFEVERSADARTFNWLLSVAGLGDSQLLQDYQAIDAAPLPGVNYYRLKQVDKDGRSQWSGIVSVNMNRAAGAPSVRLYPNPVSQVLYITITSTQELNSALHIYNAAGTRVISRSEPLIKGQNDLSVNVNTLAPGVYFCQFDGLNGTVRSFVKE